PFIRDQLRAVHFISLVKRGPAKQSFVSKHEEASWKFLLPSASSLRLPFGPTKLVSPKVLEKDMALVDISVVGKAVGRLASPSCPRAAGVGVFLSLQSNSHTHFRNVLSTKWATTF